MYSTSKYSKQQAVITFVANGKQYNFLSAENLDLKIGETVDVIFSRTDPTKAFVNNFFGFWFRPLLLLPIIIWSAIAMGITGKNSYWTLKFFPLKLYRTDILQVPDQK